MEVINGEVFNLNTIGLEKGKTSVYQLVSKEQGAGANVLYVVQDVSDTSSFSSSYEYEFYFVLDGEINMVTSRREITLKSGDGIIIKGEQPVKVTSLTPSKFFVVSL